MSTIQTPGRAGQPDLPTEAPAVPASAARSDSRCHHDLLRVSCIWCSPRPGVEDISDALDEFALRAERVDRAGWLEASRRDTCARCDAEIRPGDTIRFIGRALVCKTCGESE